MPRIVLAGYYGFDNLGDDALLLSISRQLRQACPDADLLALTKAPDVDAKRFNLAASSRFPLARAARTAAQADVFLLGGGSLLQDATSFRSLFYYYSLVRAAKAGGARVVGYAQGIGPLRRRISRFFAKATVRRCDAFIARDEATLELLNAWRIKGVQVHLGADPVFDWPSPNCEDVAECQSKLAAPGECLLGVSLREPLNEASLKSLATAILELPSHWRAVVWVMSPDDLPVSRSFTHLLGDRGKLMPWSRDLERLLAGLAACEAVLAMRLHAGIFAAVAERPLALLAYDPKVVALGVSLSVPLLGTSPVSFSEASETLRCLVGMRGRPNAEQMAGFADLRRRCRIAPSIIKELIFAGNVN